MRSTFWMTTEETEQELNRRNQVTALIDIRHSEPHSPANPCSPSCEGYAPTQAARKAQRKAARKANDQARRDCGLVKGKDSLGRTIWE